MTYLDRVIRGGNGAAPESNRASRGLHDRADFEDRLGHRARAAPPRSVAGRLCKRRVRALYGFGKTATESALRASASGDAASMPRTLLILVTFLAAAVGASPAVAATTKTVAIKRAAFSPATVNIVAGDSIRWRNDDTQNHQIVSTTGAFASPVLARGEDLHVQVRRRRHLPLPRRSQPVRHRNGPGRRRAAGRHARDLAAADLLRPEGDALGPGQQQEGRRERPAQPPALRPGVRDRARDRDHRRRRHLLVRRLAEDPHHLPRPVEDRREPRDQHGRGARRSRSDA